MLQTNVDALTVSLTAAIQKWMDWACEGPDGIDWSDVGWVGPDAARLMAKSAMCALEFSANAQAEMAENGE